MDNLKLNPFLRTMYGLQISIGIQGIRNSQSEFARIISNFSKIQQAIRPFNISGVELDISYHFTSWENWQEILRCLYDSVVKNFKWEADVADCDNRAEAMSALCSLCFRLNTMGRVYCEVYDLNDKFLYLHWANLIIDKDSDVYLFDADNKGLNQKITSPTVVMGNLKYKLLNLRIG